MIETVAGRWRAIALGLAAALAIAAAVVLMAIRTQPVREAVASYTALISAANRQDIEEAQRLCSTNYRRKHVLRPAYEGGIVGLPRNIHKNFQAWRQGANVWLCPTNRVGPVYQFVREAGVWRFDGPVGLLHGRNEFTPLPDLTDEGPSRGDGRPPSNPPQPD